MKIGEDRIKMLRTLQTEDNKIIKIDTERDEKLYSTGGASADVDDLYTHVAKSGKRYFYVVHWNRSDIKDESVGVLEEKEVENFINKKIDKFGSFACPKRKEVKRLKKIIPNFFEETG